MLEKDIKKYKRKRVIWIKWRNDERKIENIWNKQINYYNKKKIEKKYSAHYNERENKERTNAILIKGRLKEENQNKFKESVKKYIYREYEINDLLKWREE